jgi:hypothetical protein
MLPQNSHSELSSIRRARKRSILKPGTQKLGVQKVINQSQSIRHVASRVRWSSRSAGLLVWTLDAGVCFEDVVELRQEEAGGVLVGAGGEKRY